ncbi:MAG: SBBP repeat-containing protein, partial [Flavobacteriales bacterium]
MRNNKRNVSIRHTTTLFMLLAMALHGYAQLAHAKHAEGKNHQHAGHDDLDGLLNLHDQEIHFMENKGQFSEPVLYRADLPMGQAIATKGGMVVTAFDPVSLAQFQQDGIAFEKEIQDGLPHRVPVWNKKGHSWKLNFTGSSPNMKVESRNSHEGISNYFMGDVSAMDVHSYQEVWYTNTYRGIDVRYYPAEDGSLEYDIICKPGSEPKQVAIEFEGIDQISVNQKGELVINTSLGEFTYPAPVVYQRVNGKESSVRAAYVVEGKNTLRFELGAYDKNETLVIDPIALRWATWMNTNSGSDNHGHCIWVDPTDGAIYVVARVSNGTDQITPGAFDETANGSYDMVVGKYLEPTTIGQSGTRVWQTYIGGNGIENPYAMEQGADGNLYITGYTASTNFPLLGGPAFSGSSVNQQSQSGDNVYIVKINTGGNSIKSAVVGGNGDENAFDLRIATNGDVIVGGNSVSTNLATSNNGSGATNGNSGGNDVLIFRINGDLSAVQWMRNYGGSSNDLAQIMLYEPTTGDIFVGGRTTSTNFPTLNPRQSTRGGNEAGFLQRISGAGTTLWSSYFQAASSKSLTILCMSMNTTGSEIYFGGVTSGLATSNISSSGVYDNSYNGGTNDLFVARMGLDQSFIGSTYVGGSSNEVNMMGLNTDLNNDVYVFGYTNSTNFPVSSGANVPLQATNNGSNDKVFLKLSADLSNLDFSTYYGGSGDDYDPVGERGIKFSNCRIYTIVTAKSNNIPLTQGALNTTKYSSDYEPGVVVWANPPDLLGNTITGNQSVCAGSVPGDITGSEPAYSLPTIVRNNSTSSYPSLGSAATYQWQISSDSLNWNDISGATAKDLPGSMIGTVNEKTYIRRIIGGDACILAGAADQVVTVKLIEATATITHVSCNGANDGAITASSTGVGPFTYVWSHGPTGATINGLAAGAYTVEVTDANGCHASKTFNVTQPAVLGGLINGVNATCNNSDGSATTNISGGTTPYTYLWSNGSTGSSVNSLSAGTHSVQVTDAHGCVLSLSVTIGSSGTPGANAGADKVITCLSGSQVTLNGSSQTGGVSYAWTATSGGHIVSGANTATPSVDAAGTYTLLVTNTQTGCSSTDQAMVTMNTAAPNSSASASGTLTCTVTSVSLNGGSTTSGASFSWTGPGGFTSTDEDPTVSAPGNYVLTVTDPTNGCTNTATATVGQDINVPVATATGGTLTCAVTSVTLQGAGNGTYSWSGPGGFTSNDQNPTVSAPGSYVLTVTGTNGCTNTATATVDRDSTVPGAQAAGGTLSCAVTSIMLQGTGNGTYSWSGPGGFTSNDQNPTVSAPGSYVLTVTGTNGCTNTATATVGQDIDVPVAAATGGTLTCAVTSVTLQGAGNGTYSWSGPGGFTSNDQNPTVSAAGTYTLLVTGSNGCTSTASAQVNLDDQTPGATAEGGVLNCSVSSIMLHGTGNGTYAWSGPN